MRNSTRLQLAFGVLLFALVGSAEAERAITTDAATVRAGPDNSYPEVAYLDADTPIRVVGCLDDWSWCDVAIGGDRGWLYAPLISYDYQGGYVPFYSYAPALGVPVVGFSVDSYWGSYYHDRPWYGQRAEWVSREPPRHERPPGPPPSAVIPPNHAVADRSRPDSRQDRPLRLGSAEPQRRDGEPNGRQGTAVSPDAAARESDRRPSEQSRATTSRGEAAPRAEAPPRPTEPRTTEPGPAERRPSDERAIPQRGEAKTSEGRATEARPNEGRPNSAERAAEPRHEEHPAEPPPH